MTNAHHKYIIQVGIKFEHNGEMKEHIYNRLCNNENTLKKALRKWEKELNEGTFLYGTPYEITKPMWVEER